ncbi:restriction endonuclease subunit S [Clostridium sp. LBM24168]
MFPGKDDYISLIHISKYKNPEASADIIKNWLRNRSTIEFLGLWERMNNPNFKLVEFHQFIDVGVLSTLYIVFKPADVNSDFLTKYYDTTYWYREVSKHAAEGARNHGLLNIAASDFFKTELTIPKDKAEQEKIGRFFKQFDKLITLHQRESL